jgi:outer membrane murein-binding lipoprotein Lpp
MNQKRFSLIIAAVSLAAITLLTSSSTARTRATTSQAQSLDAQILTLGDAMNAKLVADGSAFRLVVVDYLTSGESNEVGQTVFFNNRAKQLGAHFVPGDPRRGGRANITYLVDQAEGAIDGLTVAQTTAAIDRAMATWNGVNCSTIPITKLPDIPGLDIGIVETLLGQTGGPFFLADITHAGWLPAGVLPPNVIGATFTFMFVDPATGAPTDIDNNGKIDVAFREILYNNVFTWAINGNIDVETVALHESGHGLSQGHFGKAFRTDSNGKIHFSPLAVMNAAYSGVQQGLAGTDNGGHCSIWGSWPNN